jgi:hypothetical protein
MRLKPHIIFFAIGFLLLLIFISDYLYPGGNEAFLMPGWRTIAYSLPHLFILRILPIFGSFAIAFIYRIFSRRGMHVSVLVFIFHLILSIPYLLEGLCNFEFNIYIILIIFMVAQFVLLFAINKESFLRSRNL